VPELNNPSGVTGDYLAPDAPVGGCRIGGLDCVIDNERRHIEYVNVR